MGWELVRFCGMGDCGEVWACRSTDPGVEPAALKFATDPAASRQILASRSLFESVFAFHSLAGIVPLRAVNPDEDMLYLETGYVRGYDLTGVLYDWKWRARAGEAGCAPSS